MMKPGDMVKLDPLAIGTVMRRDGVSTFREPTMSSGTAFLAFTSDVFLVLATFRLRTVPWVLVAGAAGIGYLYGDEVRVINDDLRPFPPVDALE